MLAFGCRGDQSAAKKQFTRIEVAVRPEAKVSNIKVDERISVRPRPWMGFAYVRVPIQPFHISYQTEHETVTCRFGFVPDERGNDYVPLNDKDPYVRVTDGLKIEACNVVSRS